MSNEESGCAEIVEWGDHRFRCPTAKAAAEMRRAAEDADDLGGLNQVWTFCTIFEVAVALGCHRIGG